MYKKSFLYIITTIVIGLLTMLMFFLHPYLFDDCMYRGLMPNFLTNPDLGSFITDFISQVNHRINTDNGRLANIVGILLVVSPKWLSSIVLGTSVSLTIYGASLLAGVWKKSFCGFSILVATFCILPPWQEYMYTVIFALNYVASSVILVWTLLLVLRKPTINAVLAFFLGIIVGAWHELFGSAFVASLVSLILFFKQYRVKSVYSALIGALVGIVYLALVPGASVRSGMFSASTLFNMRLGFTTSLPFFFLILIAIYGLSVPKYRPKFFTPSFAVILASAFAGWIVFRCFMVWSRVAWCLTLMSCIGYGYAIRVFAVDRYKSLMILCNVLLIGVIGQLCATIPWFVKIHHIVDRAWHLVELHKDKQYIPIEEIDEFKVPLYTLNRPNFGALYILGYPYRIMRPAQLWHFYPDSARVLPKGSPNTYEFSGMYLAKYPESDWPRWKANIYYNGKVEEALVRLKKVETISGTYNYLAPEFFFAKEHIYEIDGIELIEEWPDID